MDEKFEFYKHLRGSKNSPFWMYNVYDIDTSEEKDDNRLWYEYNEFLYELSNQSYRQFAHDAGVWAENMEG